MNNFIFKSPKRLIKNSSANLDTLAEQNSWILREMRHQRSDLKDIKLMINKLLIDKHLQMQVDEYFEDNTQHPEEKQDLD